MLLGLLFVLSPFSFAGEWVPVEEMNPRALFHSAFNGPLVLTTNFAMPKMELTLFDFRKGKALTIDDGRLEGLSVCPVAFGDGFALLAMKRKLVYLLDGDGAFVSQWRLGELSGWDNRVSIRNCFAESASNVVLELQHPETNRLQLIRLDLVQKSLALLHEQPWPEPFNINWLPWEGGFLSFCVETGELVQYDANFTKQQTLRQAEKPVKKERVRPNRSPYRAMLEMPVQIGDTLYFRLHRFRDRFGNELPEPQFATLQYSNDGFEEMAVHPLAAYEKQMLVLAWEAFEFQLQSYQGPAVEPTTRGKAAVVLPAKEVVPEKPDEKERFGPLDWQETSQAARSAGTLIMDRVRQAHRVEKLGGLRMLYEDAIYQSHRRKRRSHRSQRWIRLDEPSWIRVAHLYGGAVIRGFDGDSYWHERQGERPIEVISMLSKKESTAQWGQELPVLLLGNYPSAQMTTSDAVVETHECEVVRLFEPATGSALADLWVDRKDGLVRKRVSLYRRWPNGDPIPDPLGYDDYREISGIPFAHKRFVKGRGAMEETLRFTLDPKLPDDFFQKWTEAQMNERLPSKQE